MQWVYPDCKLPVLGFEKKGLTVTGQADILNQYFILNKTHPDRVPAHLISYRLDINRV
jgi:hypothetical protein